MEIKVDTKALDGLADLTASQLKRAAMRGINNAAFSMRNKVPDIVRDQVDRVSPKLRVRSAITIRKATADDPSASITIGGGQGKVLARHEFGFTAKAAAIPVSRAGSRASDKYGNLVKRARPAEQRGQTVADTRSKKRRKSKTEKRVPRYVMIGRGHRRLTPGIYERTSGNKKLVLIAKSERDKKYKASFRIRERVAEDARPEILKYIQESIDFRRNQ